MTASATLEESSIAIPRAKMLSVAGVYILSLSSDELLLAAAQGDQVLVSDVALLAQVKPLLQ